VLTRHDSTIQAKARDLFLKSDIAKRFNIVDVKFVPAAQPLWADYVSRGGVDAAWGGGPTLFDDSMRSNLLEPLATMIPDLQTVINSIPDQIGGASMKRFDQNKQIVWVAAAISSFGFTVNKDMLARYNLPKPMHWSDLASADFAKTLPIPEVSLADPLRSTSNTRAFHIVLQSEGWESGWRTLSLMAANSKIFDSSDAVREAVITGDTAVGVTIDFYGYTAMLRNPATEYIIPSGESLINGDPIALTKNSKNRDAAQAFMAWVLSTDGQKLWLDPDINRMPVNAKVFDTPEGQKRADLKNLYDLTIKNKGIDFNDDLALSIEVAMQYYYSAVLINANTELKKAWAAVAALKDKNPAKYEELRGKLTDLLSFKDPSTGQTVRFTLEYAKSINAKLAQSEFQNTITTLWRDLARAKYNDVFQAAQS
jgi:ABC-type Fe3+ transport system substrate-binding protein